MNILAAQAFQHVPDLLGSGRQVLLYVTVSVQQLECLAHLSVRQISEWVLARAGGQDGAGFSVSVAGLPH